MPATRNPRAHTVARRWRIPPPLRGAVGFDGPEGLPILEEIGGALGSLVWGTLRTVTAWIDTPLEERSGMFPESAARRRMAEVLAASPPEVVEGALTDLADLVNRPTEADPAAVGVACTRIARWAEAGSHSRTAAQYYQVAANACLTNSGYALAAAKAARRVADYSRAEVWLQRSIGLSRQYGYWRTYSESFLEFGTMMRRRGNLPAAERHFQRSYRRAVRAGLVDLRAQAAHDLFVIYTEFDRKEIARQWAMEALRTYPRGHSNLSRLAFDMAFVWLEDGLFGPALRVFLAVEAAIEPSGTPVVWGGIGRAAGGSGDQQEFDRVWDQLSAASSLPGTSDAWLEMARGALLLGRECAAAYAANQARIRAGERAERKIEILADQFLEDLAIPEVPEPARRADADADASWAAVAEEVVGALQPA